MMPLSLGKMRILLALSLLTLVVFAGCSTEWNSSTAPVTADQETVATQTPDTPYPVLTDEQINGLIPGFEVLNVDARAYGSDESTLDDQNSAFIRRTQGGSVSIHNNGVRIGPWQLWQDQTVTVSTPNPDYAVVDFYPHPYHFNGCVMMWIDLTHVQLPPGRRWDEVAFFYVDDNGDLVRYWGQLDLISHRYYAWPDHFSRYILAIPAR